MMMFGWTKSKRERKPKQKQGLRPARLGLLVFALACIGIAYWDISARGGAGGLTLEQPAVDVEAVVEAAGEDLQTAAAAADGDVAAAEAEEEEAGALFAAYRLERESSRDEELALLQEIIEDPASSETARSDAEQRRLAVARAMENEAAADSLLQAKGFGEPVVLISGEQATVICDLELDMASAGRIAGAVAECCGVSFENVIIVNR